jgi:hypothetical protein
MSDDPIATAPFGPADAAAVHPLIVGNRAHLDRWLRWSMPGAPWRAAWSAGTSIATTGKPRLGCREEGVRRGSHWITDRYVDHVIYGLLDREWSP